VHEGSIPKTGYFGIFFFEPFEFSFFSERVKSIREKALNIVLKKSFPIVLPIVARRVIFSISKT
jgi:hypothetical protein